MLVVVTSLLLLNTHSSSLNDNYREGDVLSRAIIVPADITTVDLAETEKRKAAAREATRSVFNFDSTRGETSVQGFLASWEELKQKIAPNQNLSETDLDRLASIVREVGGGYIYDDADADRLQHDIVLIDVRNPAKQMIIPAPLTQMIPLSTARRTLDTRILNLSGWTAQQKSSLASSIAPMLRPNVVFDGQATTTAREMEASKVESVVISLKRGQFLAREGDTVTPAILTQIAAIRSTGEAGRPWHNFFGLLFVVIGVYWAAWKFAEHRTGSSSLSLGKHKAFALVGTAILVQTALMKIGFIFGESVAARMAPPFNDPVIWNFAIPFAAAALLVAMLVDTQLAFLTGMITALFAGMLAPSGMQKALFAMVSCSAAVYGTGRYRERQSVTLAGLLVGGVNVVMALALMAYSQQPLTWRTILMAIGCGIAGGMLTAVFAAGGLPDQRVVLRHTYRRQTARAFKRRPAGVRPTRPARAGHEPALARRRTTRRRCVPRRRRQSPARAYRRALSRHRQTCRARVFRRKPAGRQSARSSAPISERQDHHQPRHLRLTARQRDRLAEEDRRLHSATPRHAHAALLPSQSTGTSKAKRDDRRSRLSLSRAKAAV